MHATQNMTPTQAALYAAAQERAERKARQARLVSEGRNTGRVVMLVPWVRQHVPEWEREETHFDQHVKDSAEFIGPFCNWRGWLHCKAGEYGLTFEQVVSNSRSHAVLEAREELIYALWKTSGLSWEAIGKIIGRHHTAAIYMVNKAKARRGDAKAQRFLDKKRDQSLTYHNAKKSRKQ